ncbi:hypothetical protein GQ55_3G471100 [Panicum hallii var. hallii]|uniref:Uncharacterized protein n=1 Tax=Panicum hallii var. hallii TaxID=1504633 RepID=A0A2T7EJ78_9POAL|nr:hypothetical protein GQ55_3G471100 [Panicum hallii var. hallii]
MEGRSAGGELPEQFFRSQALAFLGGAAVLVHCQGAPSHLISSGPRTSACSQRIRGGPRPLGMAKGIFGYGASWTFPVGLCHRLAPSVDSVSAPVFFSSTSILLLGW